MRILRWMGIAVVGGGFLGLLAITGVYLYLSPRLPSTESLRDVQLQVPLRVYARDAALMAEFGEKRREPLRLGQIPATMIKAVLASEDERFYQHPGVDWQGLTRAVLHLIRTGEKGPGGSTITMQVARNFFLGREKTYVRKANEILVALKIERELSKDEILELYLNKIFLGQRAYGVGAAAQVYYGQPLGALSLPQVAMIAGLPKAPSRFNPVANPERARERRDYVLRRMYELDFIGEADYAAAVNAPVTAELHALSVGVDAPYVAEMVRAEMEARFGEDAYSLGFKVYTTIDPARQRAATAGLRGALLDYDRRHGYRGPELKIEVGAGAMDWDAALKGIPSIGGLLPGVVTLVGERSANVYTRERGAISIDWAGLEWARPLIDENRRGPKPKRATEVLMPGDIVRVKPRGDGWELAQVPDVEGAIVALDPNDGAVVALGGGFDFNRSKFNRAVQAQRQPGSSFKPFIYSAALNAGFTPASLINDAPVVFEDPGLEAEWRPENYSGKFFGPTRMRVALTKSRNLVSIRLLRAIGVDNALDHIARFGFDRARLPRNLSLALGTGLLTPMELASAYAVLANGGYRVAPYFIERIVDASSATVYRADPQHVCAPCSANPQEPSDRGFLPVSNGRQLSVAAEGGALVPHSPGPVSPFRLAPAAISPQNAWLMNSMMRDVVRFGTGRRAMELGRDDLAGKTGTTNDQRDAWFSGFNRTLVATTWVGFDEHRPLGRREVGGRAALPMWVAFMGEALKGRPSQTLDEPEGLVTIRIDPDTGQRAAAGDPDAIFETFPVASAPDDTVEVANSRRSGEAAKSAAEVTEQLF